MQRKKGQSITATSEGKGKAHTGCGLGCGLHTTVGTKGPEDQTPNLQDKPMQAHKNSGLI